MTAKDKEYIKLAIELAVEGVENGEGGPFGALVVKNDQIIGKGNNCVTSSLDPTAHAEIVAIRNACKNLDDYQLTDCVIYTSCEPCPMCLGAIYWARPKRVVFAASRNDAAKAGFDDDFIYKEIDLDFHDRKIRFENPDVQNKLTPFVKWEVSENKKLY